MQPRGLIRLDFSTGENEKSHFDDDDEDIFRISSSGIERERDTNNFFSLSPFLFEGATNKKRMNSFAQRKLRHFSWSGVFFVVCRSAVTWLEVSLGVQERYLKAKQASLLLQRHVWSTSTSLLYSVNFFTLREKFLSYLETSDVGAEKWGEFAPASRSLTFIAQLIVQDVRLHFDLHWSVIIHPMHYHTITLL